MPTTPPPDIPSGLDQPIADYLRRLQTWAFQEIDKKIPKEEAVRHVLLFPVTQKTPSIVWEVVVNNTGVLATQQVPLGGGKP